MAKKQLRFTEVKRRLEEETHRSILQTLYLGTKGCWEEESIMDEHDGTSENEEIIPFLEETKALLEGETPEGKYDPMLFWLIIMTIDEKRRPIDMPVPVRFGFFEKDSYVLDGGMEELQDILLKILE